MNYDKFKEEKDAITLKVFTLSDGSKVRMQRIGGGKDGVSMSIRFLPEPEPIEFTDVKTLLSEADLKEARAWIDEPHLSTRMVYQNGNRVINGANGDHVRVRAILAKGIVNRVDNFGPLLSREGGAMYPKDVTKFTKIIKDGFELYVEHLDSVHGISLDAPVTLTEIKNVNHVSYQRI